MRNLAESVLALFAGRERAAALYGDLLEMSATHSRAWFAATYLRTLISLGWRTPVALAGAIVSMRLIFAIVLAWLMNHRGPHRWMYVRLIGQHSVHLRVVTWNLSMLIVQALCFAAPFLLIRFGLRSRLTRLACSLFLLALPVYLQAVWAKDLFGILIVIAIVAALISPIWRRPLIVLAGMGIPIVGVTGTVFLRIVGIYHGPLLHLSSSQVVIYEMTSCTLAAISCLILHNRMLRETRSIAHA